MLPWIVGCVGCCEGFKCITVVGGELCSNIGVDSYLESIEGIVDGACNGYSKGANCSTFVIPVAESSICCRDGGNEGCVWWKVVCVGVSDEAEEE